MTGSAPGTRGSRAARLAALTVVSLCLALLLAAVALDLVSTRPHRASWGSATPAVVLWSSVAVFCFPAVGALITFRHPGNIIGWLLLCIGLLWAWPGFTDAYLSATVGARSTSLPDPAVVGATAHWMWVPAIGLMGTFLILMFPDGRLPSARWRPVAWLSAASIVVGSLFVALGPGPMDVAVAGLRSPWTVPALEPLLETLAASLVLLALCIVACAAGLVVRFHRSRGVERLQLKWLAAAGGSVALLYLVAMLGTLAFARSDEAPPWVLATQDAALVSFGVVPVAIGVAVLRHRLYGIDVVLTKAVVLAALASFITVVYVAIVVGVGSLVGRADEPDLALSIAATAVVAVAFQPARDRVQRFANRLVYGVRATPYEVLADLADRMGGAYDAVDLLPTMVRLIGQGVGASRVDIWLAIGSELRREASWPASGDAVPGSTPAFVSALSDLQGDRVVAVRHHGEVLGAFVLVMGSADQGSPAEHRLVEDVAAQAGLVLRNVRLIEELRSSTQRLVTTQEEERRRLERALREGAQQRLAGVALGLRSARARCGDAPDPIGPGLDSAVDHLSAAIDELRELAHGLHPAVLTQRGLPAALRSLAERSPVPVSVEDRLRERLSPEVETALYFVASEALTNVAKYACCKQAHVCVVRAGDDVVLTVTDDGVGGADATRGSGLRGLGDRVAVVDGTLRIASPPGHGTQLVCRVPARSRQGDVAASGRSTSAVPQGVGP